MPNMRVLVESAFDITRTRRLLVALVTTCAVAFGIVSEAASLTFEEYGRLSQNQKENFVATALHFYYYTYKSNPDTASKAVCMVKLENNTTNRGHQYMFSLIMHTLDNHGGAGKNRPVEGFIQEVIDRECAG